MRLICRRLCPSKLCALKWTRLFAEFIGSFLRLRRTPDFGQLWHVNPSAFILSEMIGWPHAVHTDLTDWLTLLPYYPASQLCLKGSEPSFQIRGVTTSVNFNLQTSYRNWSSPWFWTTQPRNKFPNWSLASHSFPLGSFSKCLTKSPCEGLCSAPWCQAIAAVPACLLQCAGSDGLCVIRPLAFLAVSSVLHSKSPSPFLA